MHSVLAVISFLIVFGGAVPYIKHILEGKVRPARSTRVMFLLLIVVTLIQQIATGSGWALALTFAEMVSAFILLIVSLRRGVGGMRKIDIICYALLAVDLFIWAVTKNPLLALHLSIVADTIAFWPVLHKTWKDPKSETAIFYLSGVIGPLFSALAEAHPSYRTLVFPFYIAVANGVELILIYGIHQRRKA